jgi:hypothetical protein
LKKKKTLAAKQLNKNLIVFSTFLCFFRPSLKTGEEFLFCTRQTPCSRALHFTLVRLTMKRGSLQSFLWQLSQPSQLKPSRALRLQLHAACSDLPRLR